MITNYAPERAVGEVWIDSIDGAKVITVAGNSLLPLRVVPAQVQCTTAIPAAQMTAGMGGMYTSS